ncbi:MAG: AAA family ATPase [Prevotella sp.]|nr:AAA family ATPase [Prevotella sp.]
MGTTLSKNITAEGRSVTASPGELSRGPFIQPLYAALETADYILVSQTNFDELYPLGHIPNNPSNNGMSFEQKIFFGTPGSGKSWTIKETYEKDETKVVRTTFHPDTDYAQFVGCYKPKTYGDGDEKKISYEFTPQAFTEAYVKAWSDLENPYYLIIEEINRGNCAQIFGDLFQLLDRNKDGYSEYPIKADHDLREYLELHLPEDNEGIKDGKLCLPPNLSIIASMNTSDQSLFPMDSAFKRRWSWEYVPIDYNNKVSALFKINIDGVPEDWHEFLKTVNEKIKKVTSSEDKQMGNFFIKQSVDEKEFCDKVMFYLWSEVGKDNYQTSDAIFKYYAGAEKEPKEFSFNELYNLKQRTDILKGFIRYIKESEA